MIDSSNRKAIERNVALYPVYQALFNCYFWMPVFFLYFSRQLALADVLRLEAIYYLSVVALEVPSGYFSDRLGRRLTLLVAAASLVSAYVFFAIGQGFVMLATAQVLLAAGMAFNSGTDTSFHFDSLAALGLEDEYAAREARAGRIGFGAKALTAIGGGLIATWQLRAAYVLAAAAAVGLLVVVIRFVEPPVERGSETEPPRGFLSQLATCVMYLRRSSLAWLFGFACLMTVINHVPYEFYQPYIDLLVQQRQLTLPGEGTPLLTGVITAAAMLPAAWAAGASITLRDRFGLRTVLLGLTLLQVAIMAAMGLFLHEIVVLAILLRSVPAAAMNPPLHAAIVPQVARPLRATYLSIQSLAGRLCFAATLVLLSLSTSSVDPDWPSLSRMSLWSAAVGLAGFGVLVLSKKAIGTKARRHEGTE